MANNELFPILAFINQEEPPSEKFNTLQDNIQSGLEMLASAIVLLGGDDSVLDDPDVSTELKVTASSPSDMYVHVATGLGCVAGTVCQNTASATRRITAPTTNPRYTIVQISNQGVITTVNGAEAGSPVEPAASANNMKLAAIYLPQNCTQIDDSDQGKGYIIDRRSISSFDLTAITRSVGFTIFGQALTDGGSNGDGYYVGTAAGSGFQFGDNITVNSVFISAQTPPTGADLILTIHNKDDATSDTATLSDGSACGVDSSISLSFDTGEDMAIQVTQTGSSTPAGYLNIVINYTLQ